MPTSLAPAARDASREERPIAELELTRTPDDRRRYALEGVGSVRLSGLFSRSATVEAGGARWRLERSGLAGYPIQATDAAGGAVGTFEKRTLRRGGTLRWKDRDLELRPDSAWRERYVLADDERELATIEGRGWGKRPVKVTVGELAGSEPALVLFAAFVVRALTEDAAAAAGAATP